MRKLCWLIPLVLLSTGAQAARWQICDLTVKVLKVNAAEDTLRATVQKLNHRTAHAECPSPGQILEFTPETLDYQSGLPRKRWPSVAETAALQYRYLDGTCHLDNHDGPCRIKHYPMPR